MKTNPHLPILVVVCLLLCGVFAYAQTPIEKTFPGDGFGFHSVEQLSQGGYIAVGNSSPDQILTVRMNEQGDSLWTKRLDSPRTFESYSRSSVRAAVASDNGLFILTATYGGYWATGSWTYNAVRRTNAQGDSLWSVNISSISNWAGGYLNDIVATPDGGCVVAGAGSGGDNPRIVKISSTGTITWVAVITAGIYSHFNSVCLTSDGGYIATGVNQNNLTGLNNLLVAKFNGAGATVWSKTFYSGLFDGGDLKKAEGLAVVGTPDGGCMLAGYVTDPGIWGGSALLMRLNASGDSLWTKRYFRWPTLEPTQLAKAYKLLQLPSGQYLMYVHQLAGNTAAGATLVKLSASGDSLWSQVGYDYRIMMRSVDREGGILFTVGWDNAAGFIRTTAGGLYVSPQLGSPGNNATGVSLRPNLMWYGQPHRVSSYRVQVARDSGFTNIIYDQSNVTTETVQTTQLLSSTKHFWRVQSFGREGGPTRWSEVRSFTTQAVTSVEKIDSESPTSFSLEQNYPNPFNPVTNIEFALPKSTYVALTIFDVLGSRIQTLVSQNLTPGMYHVRWDATNFPSGVYFYRLEAGDPSTGSGQWFVQEKKLLLLK